MPAAATPIREVETATLALDRFRDVITPEQYERFQATAARARQVFAGRTIWNVNSTSTGGGVAEMLRSLVAYIKGAGVTSRWLVVPGDPAFFQVTKRIHNHLHGDAGDRGPLDDEARRTYEAALRPSVDALAEMVAPDDIVLVHDPQPAGLVPAIREMTPHVVWRCHVGVDAPNDLARGAWEFLLPYVGPAAAYVFSRKHFEWKGLEPSRIWVIPPSIDVFSPKNRDLARPQVESILTVAGVLTGGPDWCAYFAREDGAVAQVSRRAGMVETAPATIGDRLVVQVSRWDRLKDPTGVIRGFAAHVAPQVDAHLIVAGPSVDAVADDPEGREVLMDSMRAWEALPASVRGRVHLATLPMADSEENAAIVNALQRQAEVVVQKSLAEGFGLTVAEAMWKGRPVVASRIGGIQDQIDHGRTGVLVDDPRNLAEYGSLVRRLLEDQELAGEIGRAARQTVRDHFLAPRHLMQYMGLLDVIMADSEG